MSNLLLRWSIGSQDTTILRDYVARQRYRDFLWLAKLSISSFQRWLPDARFVLFYNGSDFEGFKQTFLSLEPALRGELEFVNQPAAMLAGQPNPYAFYPLGVWWKWIPFRYDTDYHEISVDTDIICWNEPKEFIEWAEGEKPIVIAAERFPTISKSTCGDFAGHPILKGKRPLNCGVVGMQAGHDYSGRFYEVANEIQYGQTHDSMFITEQGAINVWSYSLELEGVETHVLDFARHCWVRDFLFFLDKGYRIETVHATSWHKQVLVQLHDLVTRRVFNETYGDSDFVRDALERAKALDVDARDVLLRQISGRDEVSLEKYFVG